MSEHSLIEFPRESIIGTCGRLARLMSEGNEIPVEFLFVSALTMTGAIASGLLTIDIGYDTDVRLYTALLGESGAVKKSTARKKVTDFYQSLASLTKKVQFPHVCDGVGSAEGVARLLKAHNGRLILAYDELRALLAKFRIEGSTLLPMITSLFESDRYGNATKKEILQVENASLSLLGCCTADTYSQMWTPEALSIGFLNRLFIVRADRQTPVAWPEVIDKAAEMNLKMEIAQQFDRLPLRLSITSEAKQAWTRFYDSLPVNEYSRRIDTIGIRLMGQIAFTTDKPAIDVATVACVKRMLEYELKIRQDCDPIDAANIVARMEINIRRKLGTRGPLREWELRSMTNADRNGLWAFNSAVTNLQNAREISVKPKGNSRVFELLSSDSSSDISPFVTQ